MKDDTIAVGAWGGAGWYVCWGRMGIWKQGKWAVEVYFPYVRVERRKRQLTVSADSALRLSWGDRAAGILVLGIGVAGTLRPQRHDATRGNGRCRHGVPLNRECANCW